tara:strand:- start:663 stop:1373 length:711 start_codon:yes stop_codon:yes gene_type:complete
MKKIKLTENDVANIVSKVINEQNMATNNGSGFSQKQGSSNTLTKFNRRQEFKEQDNYDRKDTPGENPDYFYGDGSLDRLRNSGQAEVSELSTEEIVKTLWQIQNLLSEGAPAIALRRVTELLGNMGEDVEFEDGEYTTIEESKKPINEQSISGQQRELHREMLRLHKTDKTGFFKQINPDTKKFADGLARLLGAKDKGAPYEWIVKEAKKKYGTILPNANDIDSLKLWYSTLQRFL